LSEHSFNARHLPCLLIQVARLNIESGTLIWRLRLAQKICCKTPNDSRSMVQIDRDQLENLAFK